MNAKVDWWFAESGDFQAILDDALEFEPKTEWAETFVMGLLDRWNQFGMSMFLSPKQLAILIDIGKYGNRDREQADKDVQILNLQARERHQAEGFDPQHDRAVPQHGRDDLARWEPYYDHRD